MSFVLVAHTAGDELIPPKIDLVCGSDDRVKLERMMSDRKVEREAWLAGNRVESWQQNAVYWKEEVIEIPTI